MGKTKKKKKGVLNTSSPRSKQSVNEEIDDGACLKPVEPVKLELEAMGELEAIGVHVTKNELEWLLIDEEVEVEVRNGDTIRVQTDQNGGADRREGYCGLLDDRLRNEVLEGSDSVLGRPKSEISIARLLKRSFRIIIQDLFDDLDSRDWHGGEEFQDESTN
ncbi:uncharacterized protein RSE6_07394 [Rhynchosporium secalis]|uniref:Uncharacterized protein n=1 Tax=Rhynchosporium secalis TaxID=38038 RepID=A0A1E1MCT5_RHYSE|nr:uncharacterized protein RSE6_07394 [Rhynchosporium secalis]